MLAYRKWEEEEEDHQREGDEDVARKRKKKRWNIFACTRDVEVILSFLKSA